MKRYDPIEYHTNGPGWSWAHDSVMRECTEGEWVRLKDAKRQIRALLDAAPSPLGATPERARLWHDACDEAEHFLFAQPST